nr:general transcription factor 3C polypeptide 1-like [Ciona intestinalis]|eukprot:XP_002123969.3 general transcription factor 3C polypeptide 1-like [Ciona intestinalis]
MDVFEICLNEVALEGLDGITLPTLWLRMKHRKNKIPVILSEGLKSHLWEYLVNNCDVEFFQLPHTREDPVIFDRFLGYDKTSGKHTAVAPDELDILTDPYLVKPVSHGVIKGSCPCFLTRVNVTSFVQGSDLNLVQAIDKFGERQLVIVASQSKRERMLSPPGVMREVVSDLPELEFCVLERIGRARHQGEIQTVLNKLVFKDLKTSHIHYIMKFLHTRSLVTKQSYSYARPDLKNKLHQQVLLFLPHYKQDTRTSTDRKLDEVCELLAREPGRLLECSEIMEALNIDSSSLKAIRRKLVASGVAEFKVHPGCKAAGTLMKRTLQLLKNKDALDEEDGEIPHDENPGLVAELPIAMQAYIYLLKCGEEGCTKNDFLRVMRGYGRLEARNVGRILTRAGVVNVSTYQGRGG